MFKDCAIWAKSSEVKDIKEALNKVINMEEKERLELAKKAKTIAISRYSIEKVAELLDDFSKNFLQ